MAATNSERSIVEHRYPVSQPAVWGGVPLRNVNFIGRIELLDELRERLTQSNSAAVLPKALHGLAGVGKSQVAVEYVYRHATEYDLIWWISAENTSEIQSSFMQLAARLGLPVESSADAAIPAVLETLRLGERYPRWLLIFDNADEPADVRPYFPVGSGHVLITSRNAQWSGVASAVAVDVFTRSESRELLQRRNADLSDNDADRLAEVLGDLPLAVEQAAAWRAETGMPADEYLRLLQSKHSELLEAHPPIDHQVIVEAAWNVSLDRLQEENPGALELLQVCAFFAAEPIPREFFTGIRNLPLSPALEETLSDPIVLSRAIREINRYSLARIDHRNGNTLQLHRLVQTVLRNKLNPDEQEQVRHSAHILLAHNDPNNPFAVENQSRYQDLMPHARACRVMNSTDVWVRRLAINLVIARFAWGDPRDALDAAQELVFFWREKLGQEDLHTLIAERWYARTLRGMGYFAEAREVSERALELMREHLGEHHEETLLTMHTVASDLRAKGDFEAARVLNKDAYEVAKDRFGSDDPETLAAANNYALSLRLVGDFSAAQELDQDTWQRKTVVLGENHRHTLLTLDNYCVDLREAGDYVAACQVQENTVRQLRELMPHQHAMTLMAIKNLAVARRKAGDHLGAFSLAKEAFDGFRYRYGETHPDTMAAAMNLSIDFRQTGDLAKAKQLGEHTNELYRQTWGENHPFTLAGATNLAVTLRLMGDIDAARSLNRDTVEKMQDVLGDEHPFTLACATNLASDWAAAENFAQARELDIRTLELSTRQLGEAHPSTLAIANNLSLDLRGLGRVIEAGQLKTTTLSFFEKILSAAHPAAQDCRFDIRANCDIDASQI